MRRRDVAGVDQERHLAYIAATASSLARTTAGLRPEDLRGDADLRNSVAWQLQTLGESSKHLTAEVRGRHPSFPFDAVRMFRNTLAHDHLDLSTAVLLDVARDPMPRLGGIASEELQRSRQRRRDESCPDLSPGPSLSS